MFISDNIQRPRRQDTLNKILAGREAESQTTKKIGIGARLLGSMGWNEGEGLGANAEGCTQAIRAKRRDVNVGLGSPSETAPSSHEIWKQTASSFEAVLSKIADKTSPTGNNALSSTPTFDAPAAPAAPAPESDSAPGSSSRLRRSILSRKTRSKIEASSSSKLSSILASSGEAEAVESGEAKVSRKSRRQNDGEAEAVESGEAKVSRKSRRQNDGEAEAAVTSTTGRRRRAANTASEEE